MAKIIKSVDSPRETHAPGKVIFEEGSAANCFYIIRSGEVDVWKNYGRPDQFHVATIPAGRVLGEVSSFDGHPRWATVVAKTEVSTVKILASNLKWQLEQCPGWFQAIIHDLVERFRAADELLVEYGLAAKNSSHTVSSGKQTVKDPLDEHD